MPATIAKPVINRRQSQRRQPTLGTICRIESDNDDASGLGLVWNISHGGVSMLLNNPVDRGMTINGVLATSIDGFELQVTMRVAHITTLATGDYLVGTQFDQPLTDRELAHFLPVGANPA